MAGLVAGNPATEEDATTPKYADVVPVIRRDGTPKKKFYKTKNPSDEEGFFFWWR